MHCCILLYSVRLFSLALKQLIKIDSVCGLSKVFIVYIPHDS